MNYYVKAYVLVRVGVYEPVVLRVCDSLDEALDICYVFRTENGLNCFVDRR